QILAPNEAVVAISIQIRIGETAGILNMGIPSMIVKMLRQKFDQQWSVRRTQSTEDDHYRLLRLGWPSGLRLDARLAGATFRVDSLLAMKEGDVLGFDYPVETPLDFVVNGKRKYRGVIVEAHNKRALQVVEVA